MNIPAERDRSCKGCRDDFRVTDAQIAKVLASKMFTADNTVSDEIYAQRLELCMGCPQLMGGHTCKLCGCVVQISAKLKAKSCTRPGAPLWEAI